MAEEGLNRLFSLWRHAPGTHFMTAVTLDVRGSCCPMPLIRLAKAVKGLEPGVTVEIIGDDPIFELGIREFCAARGYSVESTRVDGREVSIELRIGRADGAR
jgi:tRNA 2-thiouridine synthesizing protein A